MRLNDLPDGLSLQGGFHVGPLFVPNLKRALSRPPGKQGTVHRAQTKRRTPPWVEASPEYKAAIRAYYKEAKRLTKLTGELHVVDHIVPKVGRTVSGLHVPWNLQVIHWKPNAQKGAWVWPDMWMSQMELPL